MVDEATIKVSNPKDAIGIRKVPFSTIPWPVIAEAGLGMLEGAVKYGRHNYREIGVRASVYFDATQRHLTSWWEGEDTDPVSTINHIGKAITSLIVLRDAMMQGKWVDDRPPRVKPGWVEEMNQKAGEILDRFPNPPPPYSEAEKHHLVGPEPFPDAPWWNEIKVYNGESPLQITGEPVTTIPADPDFNNPAKGGNKVFRAPGNPEPYWDSGSDDEGGGP